MRPANGCSVVLMAVSLFAGCGTTSMFRPRTSQPPSAAAPTTTPDLDHRAKSRSAETPVPPPPAPPAYGISRIKSVGFFRVFGRNRNTERSDSGECEQNCTESCHPLRELTLFDRSRVEKYFQLFKCKDHEEARVETKTCCMDRDAIGDLCSGNAPCDMGSCCDSAVGCGGENTGCGPDSNGSGECCTDGNLIGDKGQQEYRRPGLAESLQDPFLDHQSAPDQQQTPDVPQPVSAPLPRNSSPYDHISLHRPSNGFFSSEFGQQRVFVDPPLWHGPRNAGSAGSYHSATLKNPDLEAWRSRRQAPHSVLIQPRRKSAD